MIESLDIRAKELRVQTLERSTKLIVLHRGVFDNVISAKGHQGLFNVRIIRALRDVMFP